ncbi:MAG TPA: peptidylprolyl isomerase [Bryobacteraceae bacterium]|nr:peptidylprolyl isomerase [Bryobacteraceae bacterium]
MTAGEFEEIVDTLPEQFRAAARGPSKKQFAEQLVRVKIMAQEARRQKLDQTPAVQRQLALQQENLLANALFQEMARNAKVDEAAAKQYFEQHKAEYESVHARHILIRVKGSSLPLQDGKKELTEEEALAKAQEIRKKIEAGEDFATLAKAESDDTGTAAKGGDLGTFRHGQMVPEFEKAAFTLPVGAVSEPVKTKFGYHLIQVQERDVKTFDQVRADIEKKIRPELARESMESLRKQVPVKMDDAFFGAPTPPPPLQPVK